jgi:hypothetical protein
MAVTGTVAVLKKTAPNAKTTAGPFIIHQVDIQGIIIECASGRTV